MTPHRLQYVTRFGALALSASVLVGCANQQRHDAMADAAAARYSQLRTGLVLDMAQQQFDGGDLDAAEKSVREAMAADPTDPRLYILSGRIALERGRLERSFHLLEKAIELDEELALPRYYQGVVLQRWQQYDRAEARYREAYEIEPDNVSYLMAQAEMKVENGRPEEALALLESKIQYFDQNAAIRAAMGHLHRMQQRPAKAVFYFEQAALLNPDSRKLMEELALARVVAAQYDKAIPALEGLIHQPDMKDRDDLRRALAAAYQQAGRPDKAREVYLSLARGPRPAAADWVKLGELALQSGDVFGALQAANQAMDLAPQQADAYLLAGVVQQKRNRFDEALHMFDRAAALAPGDPSPMILRGISLERAGRKTAAAEAYTEALRRRPDDGRAKRLLEHLQQTS